LSIIARDRERAQSTAIRAGASTWPAILGEGTWISYPLPSSVRLDLPISPQLEKSFRGLGLPKCSTPPPMAMMGVGQSRL